MTFPFAEGFDTTNGANGINHGINLGTNGTNHGTNGINSGANKIVNAMQENPAISLDSLSRLTGLSRRTVAREVELLKIEGRLKRVGSTRSCLFCFLFE